MVSLAGMGPIKALCSTPRKHIFFSTVGRERERLRVLVVRGRWPLRVCEKMWTSGWKTKDLISGFMSVHVPLRSGKCSIIGQISRLIIFVSSAFPLSPSLYHDNVWREELTMMCCFLSVVGYIYGYSRGNYWQISKRSCACQSFPVRVLGCCTLSISIAPILYINIPSISSGNICLIIWILKSMSAFPNKKKSMTSFNKRANNWRAHCLQMASSVSEEVARAKQAFVWIVE